MHATHGVAPGELERYILAVGEAGAEDVEATDEPCELSELLRARLERSSILDSVVQEREVRRASAKLLYWLVEARDTWKS